MKTRVLLIGAICALSVMSCSTDREEQQNESPAPKLDLKKKEINNQQEQTSKIESDTIKLITPSGTNDAGFDPGETNPDDGTEIIPPGDVKPPKK